MPLWSKTVKPKWLTEEQKSRTALTPVGWVYTHPNGDKEVLVASGGLYEAPINPILGNLSVSPNTATVGQVFTGIISGKTTNSTLTLTGTGIDGLSIVGNSIVGTPTTAGTIGVRETLANATNSPKTNSNIASVSAAPSVTLNSLMVSPNSVTAGQSYNGTISGRTSGSTFSLSGLGATGLSVNNTTGVITGTPTTAGAVNITETLAGATNSPRTTSNLLSVNAAPSVVALDTPVSQEMMNSGLLVEAYGFDRLVPGYSANTVNIQNVDTSANTSLGFDNATGKFNAGSLPSNSNLLSAIGQNGTGIPLSLVAGGVAALTRSGVAPRLGTVRDASEQLTRSTTDGAVGVNLAGLGSLMTGALPVSLSTGGYEIHLLWSPNNRKIASNDSTDPLGGNNTRENIICYGTNSNNQMIAYMGGGTGSDFCRMQAGGQMNQTTGKSASGTYRFKAKGQHVTSYVMSATNFMEIEHGKITKNIAVNAATTTAVQGASMDNGVVGIGSVFSSTSATTQSTTNRGDIVVSAVIITKALTDEQRFGLQARLSAIGQQHRIASAATVLNLFDEVVDHRDVNIGTGRVTGKNSKLNVDFNVASGLFTGNYSIPGIGVKGIRSTSTANTASYVATDNYYSDVLEGTVMRLSFWESNAQNSNLAQDLSMSNGGEQTAAGYSLLLGYHHSIPAFGTKPSNVVDPTLKVGTRNKADGTSFGAAVYDGSNQTLGKYNFWNGHLPMVYGETISGYVWTKPTWENTDTAAPYKLDAPVYNPVADSVQYPFKPNQLQLHIATFAPPAEYNTASPDPSLFLSGKSNSYVSGGGIDPIGHIDGSVARATRIGVRHATSDHRVKSVQYQYAFQGTRCLWGFAKRQLTETEIETIQVNLYKLVS